MSIVQIGMIYYCPQALGILYLDAKYFIIGGFIKENLETG